MKFGENETPVEVIKKVPLEVLILETFILALMGSGTKIRGNNLIS